MDAAEIDKSWQAVGNVALARAIGSPKFLLRHTTYVAGSRAKETVRDDGIRRTVVRVLPMSYAPEPAAMGLLSHAAFALKHELPNLGLLAATFRRVPPRAMADYVALAPTGAYARRLGYLYEWLTGADVLGLLGPQFAVGGNFVNVLDPERVVTGEPVRVPRWRVDDNLLGTAAYAPMIERTPGSVTLGYDWRGAVAQSLGGLAPGADLLHRTLGYLYRKETRSSFLIERDTPSAARSERFIAALQQAGRSTASQMLSETSLTGLQRLIVDERFAAPAFRAHQNYVGSVARWENVVHYVPPPPELLPGLMAGLASAVERMGAADPVAQATVASFGFVFHHPFEDGNGRIHRFLLHDCLVRRGVVPDGVALPVSAAIMEDAAGYDRTLEAYSKLVGDVAQTEMDAKGALTVTNPAEAAWVWRYPDLTPQMEFLGKAMRRALAMIPEEILHLMRHDAVVTSARDVIDLPDARLNELLACIHSNHGRLSKAKRGRFAALTDAEVQAVEKCYEAGYAAGPETTAVPAAIPDPARTPGRRS